MAVKARNRKRMEREERLKKAVKIKCCYCDAKETCAFRERKEKDENKVVTTLCMITPNVISKKKKKAADVAKVAKKANKVQKKVTKHNKM